MSDEEARPPAAEKTDEWVTRAAFVTLARAAEAALRSGPGKKTFLVFSEYGFTAFDTERAARHVGSVLPEALETDAVIVVQLVQLSLRKPPDAQPQCDDEETDATPAAKAIIEKYPDEDPEPADERQLQ